MSTTDEPPDFGDRTGAALVTGGSGGLGAACCELLARRGSDVVVIYRSSPEAAGDVVERCREAGVRAEAVRVDLGQSAEIAAAIASTTDRFGGIHTLVHAAGPLIPQRHLSRIDPATFDDHVRQEVSAFFSVASQALPQLRGSAGSIVAITTAATERHPTRDGLSSSTKAAVNAIVRGLAAEEGRFGVRANTVGPGMLTDGMAETLMASGDLDDTALDAAMRNIPLRRFGAATDIAEAVCFLASPRAGYITGQHLVVDGGYTV